jgi:hypothetical protein
MRSGKKNKPEDGTPRFRRRRVEGKTEPELLFLHRHNCPMNVAGLDDVGCDSFFCATDSKRLTNSCSKRHETAIRKVDNLK